MGATSNQLKIEIEKKGPTVLWIRRKSSCPTVWAAIGCFLAFRLGLKHGSSLVLSLWAFQLELSPLALLVLGLSDSDGKFVLTLWVSTLLTKILGPLGLHKWVCQFLIINLFTHVVIYILLVLFFSNIALLWVMWIAWVPSLETTFNKIIWLEFRFLNVILKAY